MYSQKPFSEFKLDVQELCKSLWPLSTIDDSTVQYVEGGSSNRVVALKIRSVSPRSTLQAHHPDHVEALLPWLEPLKSTIQAQVSDFIEALESQLETPSSPLQVRYSDEAEAPVLLLEPIKSTIQEQVSDFIEALKSQLQPPKLTPQVYRSGTVQVPELLLTDSKSTLQTHLSNPVTATDDLVETDYILRIPRDEAKSILPGIAILDYIRQHTHIPIPSIISYDSASANAIQRPYTVQLRVPGDTLLTAYPRLKLEQKYAFVHQYAEVLRSLRSITSPVAGELGLIKERDSEKAEIQVLHFTDEWVDDSRNGTKNVLEGQTTLGMLLMQFERHLENSKSREFDAERFERLSNIAREMDQLGCLGGSPFVLCHGDLFPRNIMVKVDNNGLLKITGVLDWDGAMFAPRFMPCLAPHWIWDWDGCDENDEFEPVTNKVPKDPAMQILKDTFEALMGQEFVKLCYQPQYRLARILFYFARVGLHLGWDHAKLDKLVSDWALLRGKLL
ncbi:hypothetical protein MMC11_004239 [Xylographa trunciseda]|nr:hypothetical protein [Xylographa trunciseda]